MLCNQNHIFLQSMHVLDLYSTFLFKSKHFWTINMFLKSVFYAETLLHAWREVMTSLIMHKRGNFRSYIICDINQCHLLGEHYGHHLLCTALFDTSYDVLDFVYFR